MKKHPAITLTILDRDVSMGMIFANGDIERHVSYVLGVDVRGNIYLVFVDGAEDDFVSLYMFDTPTRTVKWRNA